MAGAERNITINDHVSPMLRSFLRQVSDFSQPLAAAGLYMYRETAEQFKTEGSHQGTPWAPLNPSTIKRRREGKNKGAGFKILQDTRELLASITSKNGSESIYELSKMQLRFGTAKKYARIHQQGGDIQMTTKAGSRMLAKNKTGGMRFMKLTKGKIKTIGKALDRELSAYDEYISKSDVGFLVANGFMSVAKGKRVLRSMSAYSGKYRRVSWSGGKSYSVHIPARPFLIVTDTNVKYIAHNIFLRYAMKGFK